MRLAISFLALLVLAACNDLTVGGGAVEQKIKPVAAAPTTPATDTASATTDGTTAPADAPANAVIVINNDNPLISNSQNFEAVTEQATAEADKARLEAQKKKFAIIAPTALPTRSKKTVSVVQYALNSTNAVGEKKYTRGFGGGKTASARNCAKFSSSDDAQVAFLQAGGPKRDSKNLDPDGDGFACDWSPDAYRKLVQ
ncbi:MAG: hypothetical protein GXP05_07205 [Alphaproteobacteria bacterium]|nr:hypothetical protein [Alphaproteobacteria bacterium]